MRGREGSQLTLPALQFSKVGLSLDGIFGGHIGYIWLSLKGPVFHQRKMDTHQPTFVVIIFNLLLAVYLT